MDKLLAHESLFINELALEQDFMPKIIKYRENQQRHIADCIKPLLQNRNGRNLFITGSPGIGKTLAARAVLEQLEQEVGNEIFLLYINCWKNNSSHRVILSICEQIGYSWVQNRRTEELMREAANILNKKSAVIVLDEVDKLESHQILYHLLEGIYRRAIIPITNKKDWIASLDQRIRSRLLPELLEFQPYTIEETKGILFQRVECAFVKGVWSTDAFSFITEKAFELKDIRMGLFLLREAGIQAENCSSRKIMLEHAQSAFKKIGAAPLRQEIDNETQTVLTLIKESSSKQEAYEKYKEQYKKSYRTFQRKLKEIRNAKNG